MASIQMGDRVEHRGHRLAGALAVAAAVSLLASCQFHGAREPNVIGVVASVELLPDNRLAVTVESGTRIEIDRNRDHNLTSNVAGGPDPGQLLLYGDEAFGGRWWVVAYPATGGCYLVYASGVDDGDHVKMDFGVRLPKAPAFDPGVSGRDGTYDNRWSSQFCLDGEGRVTAYRG